MTSCEECEKVHLELHKLPDCETCARPVILTGNQEALQVYGLCRSQLIVSFSSIIGVSLPAIKVAMDLLLVEDQISCAEKVLLFSEELYKKV